MRPDLRIVAGHGISPMDLEQGVAHYLDRLRMRGASANTLKAYGTDLRHYVAFVERLGQGTLVAVQSPRHVDRFFDDQSAQGIASRSQARRLAVLRGFYKHAKREGWIGFDPSADVHIRFRTKRVIAPEMDQLHAMVDAIPRSGRLNLRDRAMLRLALDTGLRISEVAGLDIPGVGSQSEINLKAKLAHVVAKGGDTETVAFNDRTAYMLEEWLQARSSMAGPECHALFVSQMGRRLCRNSLHHIVRQRGAAVGLDGMHWHLIRHRRGAMVITACGDKIGQQFLRHSSLASTSHYGQHADNASFALIRERADVDAGRKQA